MEAQDVNDLNEHIIEPRNEIFSEKDASFVIINLIIAFLPTVLVFTIMLTLHSAVIAMLVMHWIAMLGLPLIFVLISPKLTDHFKLYFTRAAFHNIKSQIWIAGVHLILIFIFSICGFLILRTNIFIYIKISTSKYTLNEYGLGDSSIGQIIFGLYFCILNPIIEEWFWRVYLYKVLSTYLFPISNDELPLVQVPDFLRTEQQHTTAKEPGKIVICIFYALYHFAPIYFLSNWLIALCSIFFLLFVGRWFVACRESCKLGLINSIAAHIGLDAAVVVGFSLIYYNKV
eukprot:GHVL01044052.1.p1 GENE.GHVL01044052.1~~GHVL01044052.1.p1  ORF type:complete len:287 (+),score=20.98 GHVL01044052.1:45-905(+)